MSHLLKTSLYEKYRYILLMLSIFISFALLMFSSGLTYAIGFDHAKLHSHMGEPLDVRIPLNLAAGEDITAFNIQLASPDEYKRLEQLLPTSYFSLRLDIDMQHPASPMVLISSVQAIDEAMLSLVIKTKRGRGRFYKKIQIFLNASPLAQVKKNNIWKKAETSKVAFSALPKPPLQHTTNTHKTLPLPTQASPHLIDWARRDSYGPVQSGDSLSMIAYRLRKDKRWSNQDIISALYHKNPHAFHKGDINQLKKGSFLTVPSAKDVKAFIKNKTSIQAVSSNTSPSKQKPMATKPLAYYGKISLGLVDTYVSTSKVDNLLNTRLAKLEPLFQRSIKTELKMDSLNLQVDAIAQEIKKLNAKFDAMAKLPSPAAAPESNNYGWMGFFLLLILNLIALGLWLYRRQMKTWQEQLVDAQHANVHLHPQTTTSSETTPDPVAPISADPLEPIFVDNKHIDDKPLTKTTADNAQEKEIEQLIEDWEEKNVDHAQLFEEYVHKQNWDLADHHYQQMPLKDRNRIRTQALLVEKLHGEKDTLGRNIMLMTLFDQYDQKDWHLFCSFFADDVWQALQDDNIISFTGDVIVHEETSTEEVLKETEEEDFNSILAQGTLADYIVESDHEEGDKVIDFSGMVIDGVTVDDYEHFDEDPSPNIDTEPETEKEKDEEMSSYPIPQEVINDSFELDFSGLDITHFHGESDTPSVETATSSPEQDANGLNNK